MIIEGQNVRTRVEQVIEERHVFTNVGVDGHVLRSRSVGARNVVSGQREEHVASEEGVGKSGLQHARLGNLEGDGLSVGFSGLSKVLSSSAGSGHQRRDNWRACLTQAWRLKNEIFVHLRTYQVKETSHEVDRSDTQLSGECEALLVLREEVVLENDTVISRFESAHEGFLFVIRNTLLQSYGLSFVDNLLKVDVNIKFLKWRDKSAEVGRLGKSEENNVRRKLRSQVESQGSHTPLFLKSRASCIVLSERTLMPAGEFQE